MRPTRPRPLALLLVLAGCPEPPDEHVFRVREPVAGATLDRCNLRVRTTAPIDGALVEGEPVPGADHINWRVPGGRTSEARLVFTEGATGALADTVFGATLTADATALEVGLCDEFDVCRWTTTPVTIANTAGAPDCRAHHGGHQLFPQDGGSVAEVLPDGRVLVMGYVQGGVEMMRLSPSGEVDATFGGGRVAIPWLPTAAAPQADGGYLVFGQGLYLGRVSADGVYDTSWGNAGGTPGVRMIPCPDGVTCMARAIRADGQGGFWIAGMVPAGTGTAQLHPFVMRVDGDLTVTASTVLDAGAATDEYGWRRFAIDAEGRVLAIARTFAVAGSLAGVDTTFGTGGRVDLADSMLAATGAIAGTRAVIARPIFVGNEQRVEIRLFTDGVAAAPIEVPASTTPGADVRSLAAAIDAQGRAYVAYPRERAPEPGQYGEGVGSELIVARYAGAALDPTFGAGGLATLSGRDLFDRVSTESVANEPTGIALGPDGAPWVSSITRSSTNAVDPNVIRAPQLTLAKLRP